MNSASKVGEIFIAAGEAFKKLADLTMQLHPAAGPSDGSSRAPSAPKTRPREVVAASVKVTPEMMVAATAEETGGEAAAPDQDEQAEQPPPPKDGALALGQLADITLARLNAFRFDSDATAAVAVANPRDADDASIFYDVFDDTV